MKWLTPMIGLLVTVCELSGAGAAFIVVPNGLRYQGGNSYTFWPFLIQQSPAIPSMRYQQVYDSSAFSAIQPPGAYLTRLFMRSSTNFPRGSFGTSTNVQINFSTTSKSPDGLSAVFAENVGQDDTVVFGPAPLQMSFEAGGFQCGINCGEFPLTNAFWYNPTVGNLLLDVRIYGGEPVSPVPYGLDAQDTVGDSVSRISSRSVDDLTATNADTLGVVTAFQFDPVPALTNLLTTNAVVITWPVQPTIFDLQWADAIGTNANWQLYTNSIGGGGLYHVLTLPIDALDQSRYFRLLCPSCPPVLQPSLSNPVPAFKQRTVAQ